ncbi:alpha,alpha-phosphotrehalase [Fusibacter bizertensis]
MKWWQSSVVYQIYPRSFCDSNGDGIGDIQGIISKLDYLEYLGIDVIWLSPVYASPNEDNGYDISDYYAINPEFGSMADMDELIEKAKQKGIKIIMDLVANHTSSKHSWFQEAIKSRENPYHDYYIFRDDNGTLPSDLQSIFLGPAWAFNPDTKEYYLHLFSKSQPDLNWHNPQLREEIYKMINWWIDKGIGGFRLDVIDLIAKEIDQNIISDGPKLHSYIKEMTANTFSRSDVLTVGETWGATVEKAIQYSNLDGSEFSMIFNFEHILLDQQEGKEKWDYKELDLFALKKTFNNQQTKLHGKGWNSLFWNNHDLPRIVSRWGDDGIYRVKCAKMFATLLHMMQGTPYVYQGEELGMTNVRFELISDYKDIETLNMYAQRMEKGFPEPEIMDAIYKIGRDNARTPMQWNEENHGGFTTGHPWIQANPNYKDINVQSQISKNDSVLNYYKQLILLRKKGAWSDLIREGEFRMLEEDNPKVFAYERYTAEQSLMVICNFYGVTSNFALKTDLSDYNLILTNYADVDMENSICLRPYESIVLGKQLASIKK